jgi:hypothetical protein
MKSLKGPNFRIISMILFIFLENDKKKQSKRAAEKSFKDMRPAGWPTLI